MRKKKRRVRKVLKVIETPHYVVEDYKNPPKKKILRIRNKKIKDKHGYEHIIKIAFLKSGKSVPLSLWHPKEEPKAQKLKSKAKKRGKLRQTKTIRRKHGKKKKKNR